MANIFKQSEDIVEQTKEKHQMTYQINYEDNSEKRARAIDLARDFTLQKLNMNAGVSPLDASVEAVDAAIHIVDEIESSYPDSETYLLSETSITTKFDSGDDECSGSWNVQVDEPGNQICVYTNKLENAVVIGQYEDYVMTKAIVFSGNTVRLQLREFGEPSNSIPTFVELDPSKTARLFELFLDSISDGVL